MQRNQSARNRLRLRPEILLGGEVAIDRATNTGCDRTANAAAACQENDYCELLVTDVVERTEPTKMNSGLRAIGAGSGLTQDRIVRIKVCAPGGSVLNSAHHPRLDIGNKIGDIELAFDSRHELLNVLFAPRILQVIHCSLVRERANNAG